MTLSSLGWDEFFANAFQPYANELRPARVALGHKHAYVLFTERGECTAVCTGRLLHDAAARAELPAVGDWVAVRFRDNAQPHGETPEDKSRGTVTATADIHAVLPRRTVFSRAASGPNATEQVLAANIDTVFLVSGLDEDFNLRRIERYLAASRSSGAQPVIVLNKADLSADPSTVEAEVRTVARSTPVVMLSAVSDAGLAPLAPWLLPGTTIALLGSSGVGKSTIVNRLLGSDRLATNAVSAAVHKGRHTTTRREMIVLPSGALVIDTPGLRELQLWAAEDVALSGAFDDVVTLAALCRFHDCTHQAEPGCAVQAALADGTLEAARWESYLKLQREQAYAARRADPQLARASRDRWKKILRAHRQRCRFENDGE